MVRVSVRQSKIIKGHLLGLVNIWQLGRLALLTDHWDTVRISLSDFVGLGLSLLCKQNIRSIQISVNDEGASRLSGQAKTNVAFGQIHELPREKVI